MRRRPCQYCERPLSRWAVLLHVWTCGDCAYRRAHGGGPMTPEGRERIEAQRADSEIDGLWQAKQALAHPGRYYGEGGTIHGTTELDVEICDGTVVAVWYRCQQLPYNEVRVSRSRVADVVRLEGELPAITGVELLDAPAGHRIQVGHAPRGEEWPAKT